MSIRGGTTRSNTGSGLHGEPGTERGEHMPADTILELDEELKELLAVPADTPAMTVESRRVVRGVWHSPVGAPVRPYRSG
ncbi:hypothetical protein [Halorubrum sp. DTA98]|uniref:hypothetical protein n=1 Tax=Halorubrum sp. DTA98 TaxID=3402163 RepID=UPI003AB0B2BC